MFSIILLALVAQVAVGLGQNLEDAFENVCNLGLVDAATVTEDGSTYLFQGDYYWKYIGAVAYDYPKLISDDWAGVQSGPIDAAFSWDDGSTFLFQGDKYWRYQNKNLYEGYPRRISDGFQGIPDNVDAAVTWINGMTYFFKGDQYWRFMPNTLNPTIGNYPADIRSNWLGVPDNMTAAVKWVDNQTYFFSDSVYYTYDSQDEAVLDYPWSTAEDWYLCDANAIVTDVDYEMKIEQIIPKTMTDLFQELISVKATLAEINQQQQHTLTALQLLEEYDLENLLEKDLGGSSSTTEFSVSSDATVIIDDSVSSDASFPIINDIADILID